MRRAAVLALLLAGGCVANGELNQVMSASATGISIAYNHWRTDYDLPAANQTAEAHCAAYGRHAQMTGSSPYGVTGNMAIAHYSCV